MVLVLMICARASWSSVSWSPSLSHEPTQSCDIVEYQFDNCNLNLSWCILFVCTWKKDFICHVLPI